MSSITSTYLLTIKFPFHNYPRYYYLVQDTDSIITVCRFLNVPLSCHAFHPRFVSLRFFLKSLQLISNFY